jgi:hypothetical protein
MMAPDAINRITSTLLAISLLVIVGLIWYFRAMCTGDGRESFGDKYECSILESLEARYRDAPISSIELSQHEAYRIISLRSTTGERLWIMLNPKSAPYYKQIPQGEYAISEDEYWQIVLDWHPISTVDECLSSHVRRKQ